MLRLFSILITAATSLSVFAVSPFTGWWQGEVLSLPIVFNIYENTDGNLAGYLFSPAQTSDSIPLSTIKAAGDTLTLEIAPLSASFRGTITSGTQPQIKGTFTQGRSFTMTLHPATSEDARLYRPQTPKKPFQYNSTEITFPSGHLTMAGTLTSPWLKTQGAIALISGSGAQNRDEEILGHKTFAVIADFLTRCGWAVLRYDDRGVGGSSAGSPDDTTIDFASDAMSAVKYLRNRFPKIPVGLLGHSEGGTIAMINAAEHPDSIDFIITLAGAAVKGEDVMVRQNEMIYELSGDPMPEEIKDSVKKLFTAIADESATASLADRLDATMSVFQPDPEARQATIDVMTSPWYVAFVRLDPEKYLSRIKCPMLALGGTWDVQIDAGQNLSAIQKTVPSAIIKTYPGLNHLFQEAPSKQASLSYGSITQTISPQVLNDIADFLSEVLRE